MTHPVSVRDARASDIPAIAAVIHGCGLFSPAEAEGFAGGLLGHFDGPPEGRLWLVAGDGAGAALLSPEPAPGVWNLLFLGVLPDARRRGLARALVGEAERRMRRDGARMLLIDTSDAPPMEPARALYAALGYRRAALIPDYWAPGEGRLTFLKAL